MNKLMAMRDSESLPHRQFYIREVRVLHGRAIYAE